MSTAAQWSPFAVKNQIAQMTTRTPPNIMYWRDRRSAASTFHTCAVETSHRTQGSAPTDLAQRGSVSLCRASSFSVASWREVGSDHPVQKHDLLSNPARRPIPRQ